MTLHTAGLPDIAALMSSHNQGRRIIFETVYGSKLYGCDMQGSDHDIRGVYAPGLADFLIESTERSCTLIPDDDLGQSDDIVYFPAAHFIDHVIRMKINAVEIFFAALQARAQGTTVHPIMGYILDRRNDLINADHAGFVGHARQRATIHIEGEDPDDKIPALNRAVLALIEKATNSSPAAPAMTIAEFPGLVDSLLGLDGITRFVNGNGENALGIHTRQLPENTYLAAAGKTIRDRLSRFSRKAPDADLATVFKDLCTALRMMETAADLMETGHIVFHVPEAITIGQSGAPKSPEIGSSEKSPRPRPGRTTSSRQAHLPCARHIRTRVMLRCVSKSSPIPAILP